jgi:pimeloyl-ACP methyl ester carboxylesterase
MNKSIYLSILSTFLLINFSFAQELPRSASFGAAVNDLNDSSRTALKLTSSSGTHIMRVVEGSAAEKAGIVMNDVIVSLDGENISNTGQFLMLLKRHHGGDKIKIGFYRKSELKSTTVNLLPKPMETSEEYDIIYSSVLSGSNNLRTIITKPKGNSFYPAVLLIGGIGCYSIDNTSVSEISSIKLWSDSLTKNGFITMRVEKTGMGDSKGIPCNECDFNVEKQGYLDGLRQLKSLAYVDKQKIFIAGFSIGGVIAPLIALQEPIKGMIVYGTAGRNWLEYELENSYRQQLMIDMPADSIDMYMRAEYIRLYGLFVEKKAPEQIVKEHPETSGHLFKYPMRIEYFQQVADINIRELWMNTKAKVLAMHGGTDFVSSSTEHKQIADIVNHYHPSNASYIEIANSDHWGIYTESELISNSQTKTELNPQPVITAIKWLKDNLSN